MIVWLQRALHYCRHLYTQRIWQVSLAEDHRLTARGFALLRVISITLSGLRENSIFSRAAALSYSTLLGIGPLIAIAVMVAGTILHSADTSVVIEKLNTALHFIAPQIEHLEQAAQAAGDNTKVGVNEKLVDLLNNFIAGSRSGTLGIAGGLMLVVIVIQLFISVEESFNCIWGVRRGRSLFARIVMYWTVVTLGAVLTLAALSVLSAATIAALFDNLPWGARLHAALSWSGPLIAFGMLVLPLMFFYRFIPNTTVLWQAALVGALVAALLLFANNYLAFFYVKSVLRSQSLFGSLSILPVLMAGLYIFWVFVLLGGQVTYAVQNVHHRSSRSAWEGLNQESRESLSLLLLVLIGRRFAECLPPYTATQLSEAMHVPTQVVNESLNRLMDLQLVTMTPAVNESSLDYHYQVARPLSRITLLEFRDAFAALGTIPAGARLDSIDPVLAHFRERLAAAHRQALGEQNLEELFAQIAAPPHRARPTPV